MSVVQRIAQPLIRHRRAIVLCVVLLISLFRPGWIADNFMSAPVWSREGTFEWVALAATLVYSIIGALVFTAIASFVRRVNELKPSSTSVLSRVSFLTLLLMIIFHLPNQVIAREVYRVRIFMEGVVSRIDQFKAVHGAYPSNWSQLPISLNEIPPFIHKLHSAQEANVGRDKSTLEIICIDENKNSLSQDDLIKYSKHELERFPQESGAVCSNIRLLMRYRCHPSSDTDMKVSYWFAVEYLPAKQRWSCFEIGCSVGCKAGDRRLSGSHTW